MQQIILQSMPSGKFCGRCGPIEELDDLLSSEEALHALCSSGTLAFPRTQFCFWPSNSSILLWDPDITSHPTYTCLRPCVPSPQPTLQIAMDTSPFSLARSYTTHLVVQPSDLRLNPPESYLFVQDGLIIACGLLYSLCYIFYTIRTYSDRRCAGPVVCVYV